MPTTAPKQTITCSTTITESSGLHGRQVGTLS
jgi:hypothetical protein